MSSSKKLIKLARKWQNLAAIRRKRITFPKTKATTEKSGCSTSAKTEKGCFVVYSADQKRFLLPLDYLKNEMIRELFYMAEDEFGLPTDGPLTLPCDSEFMKYAISLIKQRATQDVQRALLTSIASNCCSLPFHLQHQVPSQQFPICSF